MATEQNVTFLAEASRNCQIKREIRVGIHRWTKLPDQTRDQGWDPQVDKTARSNERSGLGSTGGQNCQIKREIRVGIHRWTKLPDQTRDKGWDPQVDKTARSNER